jgi:type I restriction enzyme M protein
MATQAFVRLTPDEVLALPSVREAIARRIIDVAGGRVTYTLANKKSYDWNNPEEWVRCAAVAFLVIDRDYPANRIKTEVVVPRRVPTDSADLVVYEDDDCKVPYLVVESKRSGIGAAERTQAIEQLFGNANSLRAPLALYDDGDSVLFDVKNFPAMERRANIRGDRLSLAAGYGAAPKWAHVAGTPGDISAVTTRVLRNKIQYAHSLIWAGGKRDPLDAFDEWSKLLFAKVMDERTTDAAQPRQFQVGTSETVAAVANRIHRLFAEACRRDPTIFPPGIRIELPDKKIHDVVRVLHEFRPHRRR